MVVDIITSVRDEDIKPNNEDQTTDSYPKAEEMLLDFLIWCKLKDSEVMSYPWCSSEFDNEASKKL